MVEPTFALATPSYAPDYERCRLLVESVHAFAQEPVSHYIIVDDRDYGMFRSLASGSTEILTVESLLPPWIRRTPQVDMAWLSLKTPPLHNWIVQQLVKIAFARNTDESVTVFADSDVAFIRPFAFTSFGRKGQVRLFRVPDSRSTGGEDWFRTAYARLGLSGYAYGQPRPNYVGNLITWTRENAVAMCDRIEDVSGRPWVEALVRGRSLSEYVLYGVFVDQVLGEASGHFYDWSPLCQEHWSTEPLDEAQLGAFFAATQPENIAVMISAKANVDPHCYAAYLKRLEIQPPEGPIGSGWADASVSAR